MAFGKPLVELELRPVEAPACATSGATVFVLLPPLAALVGREGFGDADPICLPGSVRPFSPRAMFSRQGRRRSVH